MYATPSVDGWQYGMRDVNGYSAEIFVYGDGPARGWVDYSVLVTDYLTGERWYSDGKAKYPDIRSRALEAMRRRNGGPRSYGYRRFENV